MLLNDQAEFNRQIGVLFAAIDKPATPERLAAFWQGCSEMSLLDLGRSVDKIIGDLRDKPAPRTFTVGDLWAAKRAMRAPAPTLPRHQEPFFPFDGWDQAANLHLLAHITRTLRRNPKRYGEGATYEAMKIVTAPNANASPEFVRNVRSLVKAKNAWSADMRELARNGPVPVSTQKSIWNDYLDTTERAIAAVIKPDDQHQGEAA